VSGDVELISTGDVELISNGDVELISSGDVEIISGPLCYVMARIRVTFFLHKLSSLL
jgi:hypothetical protein